MKYYYEHNRPRNDGSKFIRKECEKLNPLPGLTFVGIAYYQALSGEIYGVVM